MRTGLISDIHSNLEALEVVLRTLARLKVDRIVCLGDLVGYGANPNECMDLAKPNVEFSIMGNHDAAVVGLMDTTYYYEQAREVLKWTYSHLSKDNIDYLENLPYIREEEKATYVHGEPLYPETFNYVYTISHAKHVAEKADKLSPITFVGHSHLRRIYCFEGFNVSEIPVDNLTLQPEKKYLIAIGSVGQSRDNDPRSAFAVFDEDHNRVEFYRVEYDVDKAAEKIMRAGLPDYFATRLFSGT